MGIPTSHPCHPVTALPFTVNKAIAIKNKCDQSKGGENTLQPQSCSQLEMLISVINFNFNFI